MNETHLDIQEYIPQRPPIVMIDRIAEIGETRINCMFMVKNDNIFVSENKLLEPGIVENIAQTIAAGAGYRAKEKNENVKLGYIAAIKNLNIYKLPEVGDVLNTSVELVNEVFSVTIVQAEVFCGSTRIADCEMRIFIEEN
ncbi:MAG: 3-hydroxyacyl-ACP dehydratase [Bacteroidales bacterium]|nr:3-hydroxyacyl-ACP dehydratase [Bacteroidales bacterium]